MPSAASMHSSIVLCTPRPLLQLPQSTPVLSIAPAQKMQLRPTHMQITATGPPARLAMELATQRMPTFAGRAKRLHSMVPTPRWTLASGRHAIRRYSTAPTDEPPLPYPKLPTLAFLWTTLLHFVQILSSHSARYPLLHSARYPLLHSSKIPSFAMKLPTPYVCCPLHFAILPHKPLLYPVGQILCCILSLM